jgi:GrpB-like predicted nucleotidyltransferase (UPF0157 family)
VIAEYHPAWPRVFALERAMILAACSPGAFERIEHVGSTAIAGLAAKPIIDMMPGVRSLDAFSAEIPRIESLGYVYVPEFERDTAAGPGMPFRRYFRKDVDGVRAFHMHVVEKGSAFWHDQLLFRNYLRFSEADVSRYAALKRELADAYNATMLAEGVDVNVGYTDHKTAFIEDIKSKARERIARSTPVTHAAYDARWPALFASLRGPVAEAFGELTIGIEHVGSTSVPGLMAKPTIDIAIGVRSMSASRDATARVLALGYEKGRDNFPDWRYFDRPDHGKDENVHLHVVPFGGVRWNQYLLFRDYLREHDEAAAAYAALKTSLAEEFGANRLGYVEAKSDFVSDVILRAEASTEGG